jgi:hypothetical protein
MQQLIIIMAILFHGAAAGDTTHRPAERIIDTASILLDGEASIVFPLFGAYAEKKWAAGWDPDPIYPAGEKIEEGAIFTTPGHTAEDGPYTWLVVRYRPAELLVQYLVTAQGHCWTITVQCHPMDSGHTRAEITYVFTGWTAKGITLNRYYLEHIYAHRLKDWEEAINAFLKK